MAGTKHEARGTAHEKMNPLLYFLLIHFLADYPLQPNALVKLKVKSYWGVLLHCCVHLACLVIVLFPFLHLKKTWIGITVIFITHNIIDQIKVTLDKKHPSWRLPHYLLDQATHLVVISCVVAYLQGITPKSTGGFMNLYLDQSIVLYILILVLVTYFYDVTRYFIRSYKKPVKYKRDYMMMLRNVFIVSIAFAVYWMAY